MSMQATINLDGQELIQFLKEHRIRVRYIPDPKDPANNVVSIAEVSTDTSNSPKGFVDHVDGLARDLNRQITQLEGLGLMGYQQNAVSALREAVSELLVVSSIAEKEIHGTGSAKHVQMDH